MTRTKSSRALVSVVLAVLMAVAFMPAISYTSFAATAKKATKVTKVYHKANTTYTRTVGSAWTLKYKLSPSKLTSAAKKVVWKSSNSKVAKVSTQKGNKAIVSFNKTGSATVTVYTKANKKAKATWKFKVKKADVKKTALTGVTVSATNVKDEVSKKVTVGETLTATVAPAGADATYQWYADGTEINGATGASYTVTAAESGKALTVKATGANKYEGTVESAATAKVETQTLTGVSVSKIDATGKATSDQDHIGIGDVLKATATGTETNNSASSVDINEVTYQWYRLSSATASVTEKDAISGATSQTYTTTSADKDKYLVVVATPKTGVKGYAQISTQTVKGPVTEANNATLSIKVDSTRLSAQVKKADGTVLNGDKATGYTYQWAQSTDGKTFTAMSGEDGAALETTPKTGYYYQVTVKTPSGVALDKATASVQYTGKFLGTATVVDTTTAVNGGDAKIGDTLQVKLTGLTYGTDYTVNWYRVAASTTADTFNKITAVSLGTAQTYTTTSADASQKIVAEVVGTGAYAGQTVKAISDTLPESAATIGALTYSNGAFKVGDGKAATTNYTVYRYANNSVEASVVTGTWDVKDGVSTLSVPAASLQGYTYFVKVGDKFTNGLSFTTTDGTNATSVTVPTIITANLSK